MPTQVTEKKQVNTYSIRIPSSYRLIEKMDELERLNPEVLLSIEVENCLTITESAFLFEDYGYFGIKVPRFTAAMFEELHELNEEINFEFDDKEEIFIRMGTFAMISLLTVAIMSSFYMWAKSRNSGSVFGENGEYELDDSENPEKKLRRIPDISYISYDSVSKKKQGEWNGFIPVPPNLVIEIVSAKRGLKNDLNKMQNVWMKNGADIGLVICPFTEKVYIFEKGISGYSSQSIHSDFSHPMLPGYTENFGKFIENE
jgi:Uma2 family endonuclease